MGIGWTWFFCISIPMGPHFYYEGIAKLGPFSFKLHHNVIGPLYVVPSFFVVDVVMRNVLKRRNKIKLCNTCI
jgi:hypothetical protein